jgi:hypothetical protein
MTLFGSGTWNSWWSWLRRKPVFETIDDWWLGASVQAPPSHIDPGSHEPLDEQGFRSDHEWICPDSAEHPGEPVGWETPWSGEDHRIEPIEDRHVAASEVDARHEESHWDIGGEADWGSSWD